ncbi:response regulator transcription factor [Carnobacterium divergens]|uniref:Response regulator transcription factor n=1 Tax=Carnobacterium divergens TaxID=2748 RepID=A0AAW8R661_CARDV|nr:response regulator transcription factor [Carnobacterium divergens]MDT1956927.1 response regulator transcription factor [Carnobacterium divergens]MDT1972897.1 response regulator transcription factor [Carnobacterium divergens]
MRILVIEDEGELANALKRGLESEGYAVDCAYDGEEGVFQLSVNHYDLVVLDLNLPKIDGIEILRRMREKETSTKVIILSARTTVEERIHGLKVGADDYLNKPFDFDELTIRVKNLLQREFKKRPSKISFCGLSLDTSGKKVENGQTDLQLTKKEYAILEYLVFHQGQVISAEELLEHVWNDEVNPFSSSLRYHISSLKKKVWDKFSVQIITTIRGQGYVIEEEE